jgi:hypothetical protein
MEACNRQQEGERQKGRKKEKTHKSQSSCAVPLMLKTVPAQKDKERMRSECENLGSKSFSEDVDRSWTVSSL